MGERKGARLHCFTVYEEKSGLWIKSCERFDDLEESERTHPFLPPPPGVLYRVTDYGGLGSARTDNYET